MYYASQNFQHDIITPTSIVWDCLPMCWRQARSSSLIHETIYQILNLIFADILTQMGANVRCAIRIERW